MKKKRQNENLLRVIKLLDTTIQQYPEIQVPLLEKIRVSKKFAKESGVVCSKDDKGWYFSPFGLINTVLIATGNKQVSAMLDPMSQKDDLIGFESYDRG